MGKFLTVRKRADKSGPPPEVGGWPLAGIDLIDAPNECRVPTSWVERAESEGWVTVEGARNVRRPGGPAADPHSLTHLFVHADAIVIHADAGDVRYKVTHQPDKYVADGDDDTPMTAEHYAAGNSRVDWYYTLRREA